MSPSSWLWLGTPLQEASSSSFGLRTAAVYFAVDKLTALCAVQLEPACHQVAFDTDTVISLKPQVLSAL